MRTIVLGLLIILFAVSPAVAFHPDSIGHIQTLNGTAAIIRGNTSIPAARALPIFRGDTIQTSKTGSLGIVLSDDTTFSLGPNSEIVMTDYLFNPREGKFSMVTKMVKGTFSYISGLIGKLSPNSIKMDIPNATIAVRGTKLLINIEAD